MWLESAEYKFECVHKPKSYLNLFQRRSFLYVYILVYIVNFRDTTQGKLFWNSLLEKNKITANTKILLHNELFQFFSHKSIWQIPILYHFICKKWLIFFTLLLMDSKIMACIIAYKGIMACINAQSKLFV